jgi:hypothetical protein
MAGKLIPAGMSFARALRGGYVGRLESPAYLAWVASLPCCCCGGPGGDAHHPYAVGYKGAGTKTADYWAIPLSRPCHDALHRDVAAWEAEHGPQLEHALVTLTRALAVGWLAPAGRLARARAA